MSKSRYSLRTWVSMAMLVAVAFVIMWLCKFLPSVQGFLDFDFKDVIICIGGFLFGPLAAAIIVLVVCVLEFFTVSHTGIIGLIMNILSTASFCCAASLIYKKRHTMMGAVIGLFSGVVAMTGVMLLWNYLITPIYQGVPREVVVAMLPTVFLPFNAAKGGMNMAVTLLLYKPVVTALRKAGLVPPSQSSSGKGKLNIGFLLFTLALLATFVTLALVLLEII